MPEYLAPGVYIEEIEIGGKPIEGVSTSTAGFLGETERGPADPRLVTGFEQFQRLYGGFIENSYLPYAVDGFFRNGGKRCFISRIVGKDSEEASLTEAVPAPPPPKESPAGAMVTIFQITDSVLDKLKAEGVPDDVIEKLRGIKDREFTDESKFSREVKKQFPDVPTFESHKDKILEKAKKESFPTPPSPPPSSEPPKALPFTVSAIGPGEWGKLVAIKIEESKIDPKYFKMTVIYWKTEPPKPVVDPTNPAQRKDPNRREPSVVEVYDSLSANPASSDFYEKRINNISSLIEVKKIDDPKKIDESLLKTGTVVSFLQGRDLDGKPITLVDYRGDPKAEPGERSGLEGFKEVDEISIVCAPNEDGIPGLTDALIEHCELLKDRFAVIQAPQNAGEIGELRPPTDSKYAAFYYPWIKILDPIENRLKLIPPGGHIAGIYAKSDTERGVHKAPANEVLRGVMELQFPITKGDQDLLNPRGVNCIRSFVGRGIRVWGARTISSDPIWKYVNVRRLFLYLEESIEEGTQWVVFEPNDHRLWARVKQSITDFLTRVWKDGALMGRTVEEAFFVKCDETTMTPDDIDNGRLIVLIGVAPVKPAEFVIFRIAQWRSGSEITE